MPNIRPVPITENQHSSWQNLIQKTIQAQNVVAGSGVDIASRTGDFTKISLTPEVDFNRMVWQGDFDITKEYQINDVVRVVPNVLYINPETGDDVQIGSTSETGHEEIPMSLGLFVCVAHVPPSWANQDYFDSNVAPAFPDVVPYNWQQGIRWTDFNVYYPVYPEIPSNFTSSVDVGGFNIIANNTFWQAMPFGTMVMKACQNGVAKTFYVVGAESGSAFLPDYLPYSP